ncbi:MAG TPA: hypothetical protein VIG99_22095 [Myxococcaceae bacterium]|jgi:hypothetical protein
MKVALAVVLAGALSCVTMSGSSGSSSTGAPGETRIQDGTQAHLGAGLTIGAGNFWDEGGQLTCALWISGSPAGERVKKGQVLERGGRRIEVVDVARDGAKGVVVLRVSLP